MNGPKLATMAWRNLWRHKRRTLLTLVSIAFGGFLAVMMTAMQDRSFSDFIDTAARLGVGHVTIEHTDYHDQPSLNRTLRDATAVRERALADPGVRAATIRVMGETMLATATDSFGAAFIAIDPSQETDDTLSFLGGLVKGQMLQDTHDTGIVLGTTLARNLDARLGDKIVFTMVDKHGDIATGMGRLSGLVDTGAPSTNAAFCLLPIDVVRDTLGYDPDEATHVALFLNDSRDSAQVATRLGTQLADDQAALTWYQVSPDLKAFIAMKIGGGRVMELIIGLLVAAGIFNTLFVSVMERGRELGILRALGYSRGQLFRMIMWESLFLGVVGVLLATTLTAGPYWWLHEHGIDMSAAYGESSVEIGGVGFDAMLRVGIHPQSGVIIVVAILFATLTAGLYPAWKAGHINPVDAIKLV